MDEKRLNLAVRIVQAAMALEREQDPAVRALLEKGLEDDKRAFGDAPNPPDAHQRRAKTLLAAANAQKTESQEQALTLYRDATAEALWGDDWQTAQEAYRGWRWVKTRLDLGA